MVSGPRCSFPSLKLSRDGVSHAVAFVITAMLVLSRLTGLLLFLPGLSARGIPRQASILFSVGLALIITPSVPAVSGVDHLGLFFHGIAGEVSLGVFLGMFVRAIFSACASAADVAAGQMGLAQATMSDPFMQSQESALAVLSIWMAAVVFFLSGMHLRAIEAVAWSFQVIPPGTMGMPTGMAPSFIKGLSNSFLFAVQLSTPVLAMEWLTNLFIAILGKIAPRMNAFFAIGTTVNAAAALAMFLVSLPWIVSVHANEVMQSVDQLQQLVLEAR